MRGRSLRRTAQLVLVAGVLAGCGTATQAPPPTVPSPSAPPPSAPAPTQDMIPPPVTATPSTPAAPPATDGSDVGACRDGRCQIQVRAGTAIPLGSQVGVDQLMIIDVSGGSVSYAAATGNGNMAGSSGSAGRTNTVQGLSVTVDSVSGDTAVITLQPA